MALRIGKIEERGPNSALVSVEGDNPTEVTTTDARNFAMKNSKLPGQISLDPTNQSGSYPVDAAGKEIDFEKFQSREVTPAAYRQDFVVNCK
jgi:hypothetical protein